MRAPTADTVSTGETAEEFARVLNDLTRSILLAEPGAAFTLQSLLIEAGTDWEQQAMVLLALLLRPGTTMAGLRELAETAFFQPLFAYYIPQKSAEPSLLAQYGTAFKRVAAVTYCGTMPPSELRDDLE